MTFEQSAPGKLIVLGEYAVLEGSPAMVMAINRFARVTIQHGKEDYLVSAPNLNIDKIPFIIRDNKVHFELPAESGILSKLNVFRTVVEYFLSDINSRIAPFHIIIDSSDLYQTHNEKYGLGSSAAISTALVRALLNHIKKNDLKMDEIYKHAIKAHYLAQGQKGSGIDVAASVYGGLLKFYKPDFSADKFYPPATLIFPEDLYFIVIYSGYSTSTPDYVNNINKFKKQHNTLFMDLINRMHKISDNASENIMNRDSGSFLNNIEAYYHALHELGNAADIEIVSPVHQKISVICKGYGGYYKPSGAGGGDIGIAFTSSPDAIDLIRHKIHAEKFKTLDIKTAYI